MATSLDALEALLQFRSGALKSSRSPVQSHRIHPDLPVPNPLDPAQPHVIEGDASTRRSRPVYGFGSGTQNAIAPKPISAQVVTTVPNPLAAPIVKQESLLYSEPQPATCAKALFSVPSQIKVVTHGFLMNPDTASSSGVNLDDASLKQAMEIELTTDKIRDALNSKPQRGKKRRNLNDDERLELTRTRNREHAKSTRMKKKARLEELLDIEKKYSLLKERHALEFCRKQYLVKFIENASRNGQSMRDCPHSSRLNQLASQVIHKSEFSVTGTVALHSEDAGMVKVSAQGTDYESGEMKTLSGVICVDYAPRTSYVSSVSLYWSSPHSPLSSVGMSPSVSVLSFEPDCTSSSDL